MRKKLLSIVLLVLVLTVSFAVSGVNAKTLKVASIDYCNTLDPPYLNTSWVEFPIMNSIFNGLVKYKPGSFEVVPDLAKDWEVSEDGTEITFYLREGVQFHKGYGEFTAEDVKFSFERIMEDESAPYRSAFAALDHVEVVDRYTAKVVLDHPMAQLFTSSFPFNAGLIVSKDAVKEMGKEKFAHNPIGTGPYQFDHWVNQGKVVLEKNSDYWDKDAFVAGSPDRVEFIPMEDAFSRGTAVSTGEIDMGELSLDVAKEYKNSSPNMSVKIKDDMAYWWVSFTIDNPPMDNKKLRKALRYIIDPDEIIEGAFAGQARRTDSMLLPSMVGYWEDAPSYDVEDVGREKVEQLLAEAGYPNGEGLKLDFLTGKSQIRRGAAEVIQAQLARYNIDLEIDVLEMGALIDEACEGTYDMHIGRYSMTPSPMYATQWFKSGEKWNFMQWENEKYDRLWKKADRTMDKEKRGDIIREMQKTMDEDAIAVWTTYGAKAWGISNRVKDTVIQPDSYTVLPWKTKMK